MPVKHTFLSDNDRWPALISWPGTILYCNLLSVANHCIGKYLRSSGLEDSSLETNIFGVKIVEKFLNDTHYVRSLRGILILADEMESLLKGQGSKNRRTSKRSYANFLCSYNQNPTHVRHLTWITNSENQPICSYVRQISYNIALFYSFRQQIYIR